MTDPIKQASTDGWIANHRKQYQTDPAAGHMWDAKRPSSTGPGAHTVADNTWTPNRR